MVTEFCYSRQYHIESLGVELKLVLNEPCMCSHRSVYQIPSVIPYNLQFVMGANSIRQREGVGGGALQMKKKKKRLRVFLQHKFKLSQSDTVAACYTG